MADNNKEKIRKLVRFKDIFKDPELLTNIGSEYRVMVSRRTRRGKDVHGVSFKPYSKNYEGVRKRLNKSIHPVDLTIHGVSGMLDQIDHVVFNDLEGVSMFIANKDKAQIAKYHNELGAGKSKVVREFWGLDDNHKSKIRKMILDHSDQYIQTEL
ncbi:MAG: hypothetical protein ROO71_08965 [Balneola sp.]